MVKELTAKNFRDFIKEKIVLIDFYGEECMPCIIMNPILKELSEKFKDKIKFGRVDMENFPEILQKYKVNSVPYFILFKDNKILEEFLGPISEEELEDKLNSHL